MPSMTFLILLLFVNPIMFNSGRCENFAARISLRWLSAVLAYRINQYHAEDDDEDDFLPLLRSPPLLDEQFDDCFPFCLISHHHQQQQPVRRDTYFLRFGRKR